MLLTQKVVWHFVAKKQEIGNLRIEEAMPGAVQADKRQPTNHFQSIF
jgi:hypothetical protein